MARESRLACGEEWRGEAVVKAEKADSVMKMPIMASWRGRGPDHFIVNV